MLGSLFERCMKRRGVKETDPYDWEKSDTPANNSGNQGNLTSQIQLKHEQVHTAGGGGGGGITQMTVAGSNASGIEYIAKRRIDTADDTVQMATTEPANQHREKISVDKNCNATTTTNQINNGLNQNNSVVQSTQNLIIASSQKQQFNQAQSQVNLTSTQSMPAPNTNKVSFYTKFHLYFKLFNMLGIPFMIKGKGNIDSIK